MVSACSGRAVNVGLAVAERRDGVHVCSWRGTYASNGSAVGERSKPQPSQQGARMMRLLFVSRLSTWGKFSKGHRVTAGSRKDDPNLNGD